MQNQLDNKVYAGFFVRCVAFAIDSLIASIVVAILVSPLSIAAYFGADFLKANVIFRYTFLDVLSYVGVAAYFVLFTYFTHTTAGKKLMRLEVVTGTGDWTFINVLYRETIGRFLSSLLCIGYLVVLGHKEKQGFHDMLCDTFVVYKDVVPNQPNPIQPDMTTVERNVVTPPVYHGKSAFELTPSNPIQAELKPGNPMQNPTQTSTTLSNPEHTQVSNAFDSLNPDSSNLANMQQKEKE